MLLMEAPRTMCYIAITSIEIVRKGVNVYLL